MLFLCSVSPKFITAVMGKKCESCKIAENYNYWSELPATKHQFFKVMYGDFEHQMVGKYVMKATALILLIYISSLD